MYGHFFFLITKELVIIYSLTGHVEVVRFPDHVLRSRGSQEKRWQAGAASYGRHKKLLVQQDSTVYTFNSKEQDY